MTAFLRVGYRPWARIVRGVAQAGAVAAALCGVTGLASAQDFKPKGPVTMVVPFGPGGGSDLMGRSMAAGIGAVRPGVQVSVDNRAGGNGVLGYNYLRQRASDPLVLLASETAAIALPLLIDPPPFQWTDFTPIAQIAGDSQLLVVAENAPYTSMADLVAAAKKRKLKVGLTSTTSSDAIVAGLLEINQGVSFQSVVLSSGPNSVARLLNGDIDFTILNPSETIGQMKAKNLRPLVAFSDQRYGASTPLAGVPTAKEQGVNVAFAQYRALFAGGKITKEQAKYWGDAMEDWSKTPSYQDYLAKNYLFPQFRRDAAFREYLTETQAQLKLVLAKKK
ncbi:MAG: tripartite tricarboxylate transporter substrate binding protein [Pseudomonadota bacterium]